MQAVEASTEAEEVKSPEEQHGHESNDSIKQWILTFFLGYYSLLQFIE